MSPIDELICELQQQPDSPTVTNQYLDPDIANNLRLYLNYMLGIEDKRILMVGEAPGYNGCRLTGIPFTSGAVFEQFDHPLLNNLKPRLRLGKIKEPTAKIVWEYLSETKRSPVFWNAFPFHPHPKDSLNENRGALTNSEIETGKQYLHIIHSIFKPEIAAGIGKKGFESAQKVFPDLDVFYIRHPSFGGKLKFIKGMDHILQIGSEI